MRIDFYGLTFETPRVTVHLWTPWRATAIEHRMIDAIRQIPRVVVEEAQEEVRITITDPKTWRFALQSVARVLKGWQEDADPGSERRSWRWLLEGDSDADGYDHNGERCSLWAFLRLGVEQGGLGEDKGEDVDLNDFGVRIWAEESGQG
jgi:hypothetical protein